MELQWIKLYPYTFFGSHKMKKLRRLPDGDRILLAWLMLLALAGKVNDGGHIYITPSEPYEVADLADAFSIKEKLVKSALDAFVRFGMITIDDAGFIFILNWSEYQGNDKYEEIKAKDRERKRQKRASTNVRGNSTESLQTDGGSSAECPSVEREEIRIKNISSLSSREEENICNNGTDENAEKNCVFLTEEEKKSLLSQLNLSDFYHYVNVICECESSGKRFGKSHFQAILDMATADGRIKDGKTAIVAKTASEKKQRYGNFDANEAFANALKRTYENGEQQ